MRAPEPMGTRQEKTQDRATTHYRAHTPPPWVIWQLQLETLLGFCTVGGNPLMTQCHGKDSNPGLRGMSANHCSTRKAFLFLKM